MTLTFVETEAFTRKVDEFFGGDEAYAEFQEFMLANPNIGTPIPGCGGVRKVRWSDPRRGKGKRGGLRLIYLYVPLANHVLFLGIYDKDRTNDLSAEQRAGLSRLAAAYRRELEEE